MHLLSSIAVATLLVVAPIHAAIGPVSDLHIFNAVVAPDGFTRTAVTAEGGAVGPLITGNKGDQFRINVINSLNNATFLQSTSIHWHGMFQRGTNYADGPAFVSQCPIARNHSFLYDFTPTGQAGTFWYHSHLSTQYCDGLRGALVIYDPLDPFRALYDVDDESTVITLSDWYHISARAAAGTVPASDSTLINGKGRWATNPTADLTVITVQKGKRYRFRLVDIACDPNFVFSIDNHSFLVIEADSVNHVPTPADAVQIFVAQRYSLVLTANQTVGNYWIRANPGGTGSFDNGINSAILRYVGAPVAEPNTTSTITALLNETNLHAFENPGAPGTPVLGAPDVLAMNLQFAFNLTTFHFSVNGVTFVPPTMPVLLQILSGAQSPSNLLPTGSVYPLPPNKTIEISLPGGIVGGGHPFHLHGHTFDVIRSAGSTAYNFANPARRDVVNIGVAGDNVTIRFRTDNPGPWFLHCHIDWHLEIGLAVVLAEDAPDWASKIVPPSAWNQLCPTYDALAPSDL